MGSGYKSKEKELNALLTTQASRRPTCLRRGSYVEPRSVREMQEWILSVAEKAEQKSRSTWKKSKNQSSEMIIKSQKSQKSAKSADLRSFTIPKRSLWTRRRDPSPIPAKQTSKNVLEIMEHYKLLYKN